jgi:hypothetical protein
MERNGSSYINDSLCEEVQSRDGRKRDIDQDVAGLENTLEEDDDDILAAIPAEQLSAGRRSERISGCLTRRSSQAAGERDSWRSSVMGERGDCVSKDSVLNSEYFDSREAHLFNEHLERNPRDVVQQAPKGRHLSKSSKWGRGDASKSSHEREMFDSMISQSSPQASSSSSSVKPSLNGGSSAGYAASMGTEAQLSTSGSGLVTLMGTFESLAHRTRDDFESSLSETDLGNDVDSMLDSAMINAGTGISLSPSASKPGPNVAPKYCAEAESGVQTEVALSEAPPEVLLRPQVPPPAQVRRIGRPRQQHRTCTPE